MTITLEEVRRRILIALFSDDQLMEILVFKGGNALALVHNVGSRASLDMDFSMEKAFSDLDKAGARIFSALKKEFASIGYVVFDEKFGVKPSKRAKNQPEWWGGYSVEFKLAMRELYDEFKHDLQTLRMRALALGPQQKRAYTIDISMHEFCEGKVLREVDSYDVYVYSLEMIAAEKLRAICQQMPEYSLNRTPTPRARDFYDIQQTLSENGIDLTEGKNLAMIAAIFAAKEVPLILLSKIDEHRGFHALDWPSVSATISGQQGNFDEYFDFVAGLAKKIEKLASPA